MPKDPLVMKTPHPWDALHAYDVPHELDLPLAIGVEIVENSNPHGYPQFKVELPQSIL